MAVLYVASRYVHTYVYFTYKIKSTNLKIQLATGFSLKGSRVAQRQTPFLKMSLMWLKNDKYA